MGRARQPFEVVIAADDHAALAGGHRLARLEAEGAADAEGAHLASAPFAAMGVRRVFQQRDAMLPRERRQLVEIGRSSAQMHRDDRLGILRDRRLRQFGIDAIAVGADVNQDGQGAGEEDCAGCGDESGVRHDDFVARAHAHRRQRHFKRVRAVGDGDPVFRFVECRELPLKGGGLVAGFAPPIAAFQHRVQRLALQLVILGPAGERLGLGGGTAVDGELGHGDCPQATWFQAIFYHAQRAACANCLSTAATVFGDFSKR